MQIPIRPYATADSSFSAFVPFSPIAFRTARKCPLAYGCTIPKALLIIQAMVLAFLALRAAIVTMRWELNRKGTFNS